MPCRLMGRRAWWPKLAANIPWLARKTWRWPGEHRLQWPSPGTARKGQYRKIGKSGKWKFSFFRQRHALSTSFDIFVVTYRVTNFLPKLLDMLLFCTDKTEFSFLVFPYFRVMPRYAFFHSDGGALELHSLPNCWYLNWHLLMLMDNNHCFLTDTPPQFGPTKLKFCFRNRTQKSCVKTADILSNILMNSCFLF